MIKHGVDAVRDIFIAKGKIAAIGEIPKEFQASRVIDARSLVVCPGFVDLSVRLREPGFEYKATLDDELFRPPSPAPRLKVHEGSVNASGLRGMG